MSRTRQVTHVESDVDTYVYFETGNEYGVRVGPRLWEKYLRAEAEVDRLRSFIQRLPYDHAPLPPAGTLARHLHDSFVAGLKATLAEAERFHGQLGV